jgi:hypothetical protein
MSNATRTCLKCDAAVRFLLCDRHYAETPFSEEPIAVSHEQVMAPVVGLPVVVENMGRF